MEDERKSSPLFELKSIPLFKSVKMTLSGSEPVKTGESQYGTWYLWVGNVENQTVVEGRGKDKKELEGYTGEVLFFPTEKVHEQLEKVTDGKNGVEISITKEAEETQKGLVKRYVVKKLSEGEIPQSQLIPSEVKLIADVEKLISDGYATSLTDFIAISKEKEYGGKITEDRAKKLYELFTNE